MATTVSIDMNFTYAQVLALAKKLDVKAQQRLVRDIQKDLRTSGFRKLIKQVPNIDDATILAECEAARQEQYNDTYAE